MTPTVGAKFTTAHAATPVTPSDSARLSRLVGTPVKALVHVEASSGDFYVYANGQKRVCVLVAGAKATTLYQWTNDPRAATVGPLNHYAVEGPNLVACGQTGTDRSFTLQTDEASRKIDFSPNEEVFLGERCKRRVHNARLQQVVARVASYHSPWGSTPRKSAFCSAVLGVWSRYDDEKIVNWVLNK